MCFFCYDVKTIQTNVNKISRKIYIDTEMQICLVDLGFISNYSSLYLKISPWERVYILDYSYKGTKRLSHSTSLFWYEPKQARIKPLYNAMHWID